MRPYYNNGQLIIRFKKWKKKLKNLKINVQMSLTSNSVEKINKEMFRFVEKMKRSRETVFYGALLLVH